MPADPSPTPAPVPVSTTVDTVKQLVALIEELPVLVSDVTELIADLQAHNLAGALGKLQAAISDLKTALA